MYALGTWGRAREVDSAINGLALEDWTCVPESPAADITSTLICSRHRDWSSWRPCTSKRLRRTTRVPVLSRADQRTRNICRKDQQACKFWRPFVLPLGTRSEWPGPASGSKNYVRKSSRARSRGTLLMLTLFNHSSRRFPCSLRLPITSSVPRLRARLLFLT
jgi:hypothetical protein